MPLVKGLIKVGNSRVVIIPARWLKYYEDKFGRPVEEMLMELNSDITLRVRKPKANKK